MRIKNQTLGSERLVHQARAAFVVMDSQRTYCTQEANGKRVNINTKRVERVLDNIETARAYFDTQNIPTFLVSFAPRGRENDLSLPYSDDVTGLYRQPLRGNFELVSKSHRNAFLVRDDWILRPEPLLAPKVDKIPTADEQRAYPSDLETRLKDFYPNVDTLIFSGFQVNVCVRMSVMGALERGYKTGVLQDCAINTQDLVYVRDPKGRGRERSALKSMRHYGAWVGTLAEYKARTERALDLV